jgi:hypothetical protein
MIFVRSCTEICIVVLIESGGVKTEENTLNRCAKEEYHTNIRVTFRRRCRAGKEGAGELGSDWKEARITLRLNILKLRTHLCVLSV